MPKILKLIFKQNLIDDKAISHSSLGEYTKTNRLKSGGHGQEALNYMKKNNIEYNIAKKYSNGVRVGNVPNHEKIKKRTGNNQSWFPKDWDRQKIRRAGKYVAHGKKYPDGSIKSKNYKNVEVGIIRTNGKISTIFPLSNQNRSKEK